jgi:hypothetical protein
MTAVEVTSFSGSIKPLVLSWSKDTSSTISSCCARRSFNVVGSLVKRLDEIENQKLAPFDRLRASGGKVKNPSKN